MDILHSRQAPTFFKPNGEFLAWLKGHVGDIPIIDCGSGNGEFPLLLQNLGVHKVLAIDIAVPANNVYFAMMEQDATTFDFPSGCIATIIRPNRGMWIHQTIEQALKTVREIIYIGLDKHRDEDVLPLEGMYSVDSKTFEGVAGKDGERVTIIRRELITPIAELVEGMKCTYCGCNKLGKLSFPPDGFECQECYKTNIAGVNPSEPFNFKTIKEDGEEYFIIAGKKLKAQIIYDYLPYRMDSGTERVIRHKMVLVEAGFGYKMVDGKEVQVSEYSWSVEIVRLTNWLDYFEKWLDAFLDTQMGEKARYVAETTNCSVCGDEILPGDGRYNLPDGTTCTKCYRR